MQVYTEHYAACLLPLSQPAGLPICLALTSEVQQLVQRFGACANKTAILSAWLHALSPVHRPTSIKSISELCEFTSFLTKVTAWIRQLICKNSPGQPLTQLAARIS